MFGHPSRGSRDIGCCYEIVALGFDDIRLGLGQCDLGVDRLEHRARSDPVPFLGQPYIFHGLFDLADLREPVAHEGFGDIESGPLSWLSLHFLVGTKQ